MNQMSSTASAAGASDAADLGVLCFDLDTLLAQSSIVSVHAPRTPETRSMIDARRLGLLRNGAIFINTASSWVVDSDALLDELRRGRIWAALDDLIRSLCP